MEQKIKFKDLSTPLKVALIIGGIILVYVLLITIENRYMIFDLLDLMGKNIEVLESMIAGM